MYNNEYHPLLAALLIAPTTPIGPDNCPTPTLPVNNCLKISNIELIK